MKYENNKLLVKMNMYKTSYVKVVTYVKQLEKSLALMQEKMCEYEKISNNENTSKNIINAINEGFMDLIKNPSQQKDEVSKENIKEDHINEFIKDFIINDKKDAVVEATKNSITEDTKNSITEDTKNSILEVKSESVIEEIKNSTIEEKKNDNVDPAKESVKLAKVKTTKGTKGTRMAKKNIKPILTEETIIQEPIQKEGSVPVEEKPKEEILKNGTPSENNVDNFINILTGSGA